MQKHTYLYNYNGTFTGYTFAYVYTHVSMYNVHTTTVIYLLDHFLDEAILPQVHSTPFQWENFHGFCNPSQTTMQTTNYPLFSISKFLELE